MTDSTYGDFDARSMAEALSYPGIDPRQWVSYGIVEAESEGQKAVEYDDDHGAFLVNVRLHPSGMPVRARVGGSLAGVGEGEWNPLIEKDEVLVVFPGGNERNAVILCRLNQSYDKLPKLVGGADTSQNTVAFRRQRTPFIWEQAGPWMLTQAVTNATLLVDKGGSWYVKDGAKSAMHIGPDWMGFTDEASDNVLQLQLTAKRLFIQVDGGNASLTLDAAGNSGIVTYGPLNISTCGNAPSWHATSIESISAVLVAVGAMVAGVPITPVQIAAAITTASSTPLDPTVAAAIKVALAIPVVPAFPPTTPNVGCAGLLIG